VRGLRPVDASAACIRRQGSDWDPRGFPVAGVTVIDRKRARAMVGVGSSVGSTSWARENRQARVVLRARQRPAASKSVYRTHELLEIAHNFIKNSSFS
jgi:hypothetical protein